ncbi:transcriptional regulator GcvA [Rhodospirillaceae bacterium SYSU D60014]|uniref:transcriptional regulator GcvA n=1 Tax=Virgifigura deserti TaxID=2268457 RepID=UPI000E660B8E
MSRRLPPLNALRAFEAAARHNSFTGAAEELGVSHAAISRHVRGLEARLDVTLFGKAPRGVVLTEAGAAYLDRIRRALDDIAEATEALTGTARLQICVSAEPAFATKWLVHRLGRFRERHPTFDVYLDVSPLLVDLNRDEADLAIRYGKGDWPGVREDLIVRPLLFPVCHPALLNGLELPRPSEFSQHTLLHEDGGMRWRRWFEAAGAAVDGITRGPRLSETNLVIDAAIAGQGIALADEFLAEKPLREGSLVRLSDIVVTDGAYYLLSLPGAGRRKPIASFRNWLLAEAGVTPAPA